MTTVSDAFPSKYLKAADLNNRTFKAKIEKVVFEEIGQNKDRKPIIYFDKVKKGLVLNKTNALEIAATYGDQMENWTGKEIELFSQMVPFQGQNVPAIRVRAVVPVAAVTAVAAVAVAAEFDDPIGI